MLNYTCMVGMSQSDERVLSVDSSQEETCNYCRISIREGSPVYMYDDEVKDLSSARFRLLLRGIMAALKRAFVDFQTLNSAARRGGLWLQTP